MTVLIKIAVIITCYNRKDKTLACLDAFFKNVLLGGCALKVFLVDGSSTDGTGQVVSQRYPRVNLVKGGNKTMHLTLTHAMDMDFDTYLWLNDDTMLYPNSINTLLNFWHEIKSRSGKDPIIGGSTQTQRQCN